MGKIKDFSKNKEIFIQFFLILVIIFTGVKFLFPKIQESFQMRHKIKDEKERLTKLTQKAAFLESLDEYELTSKTEFLLKVLPPEEDIFIPLSTLKSLVSQFSDIQIKEMKIDLGNEKAAGQLSSIGFSLKIVGSKENIVNFIDKVKTVYPLMRVNEISISLKEEELPSALIKIDTFFLGSPKEIGKVEAPLSLITSGEEKIYKEVSSLNSPLQEETIPSFSGGKENPFSL
jgi:Tfp pilus assembly protein PilO